ncbi:MAG TPA: transcription antitermination factor NusB [Candidatus Megaira endosymbiont of Nemacystus decipiens]|nr:transcription antitermination factor NusB [Candidatus Megaera endosymbiont of Nemacystus decipiens]
MKKIQLNSKSIARIAAIQTLYQYNNEEKSDITPILMRVIEFYKSSNILDDFEVDKGLQVKIKPSYSYLSELVKNACNNIGEINSYIKEYLSDEEQMKTMPRLLLSVLQVAFCELKFFPEIPRNVVINEFTDIANDMLSHNEVGFVNSILDKFSTK